MSTKEPRSGGWVHSGMKTGISSMETGKTTNTMGRESTTSGTRMLLTSPTSTRELSIMALSMDSGRSLNLSHQNKLRGFIREAGETERRKGKGNSTTA